MQRELSGIPVGLQCARGKGVTRRQPVREEDYLRGMLEQMSVRSSRLLEIFAAARQQPEAERAAFLHAACAADAGLEAEIEALLEQSGDDKSLSATLARPDSNGPGSEPPLSGDPVAGFDASIRNGVGEKGPEGTTTIENGSLIGPYRIDGQLGAGGMGVVYRAHDTRLERAVAIKVIHPKHTSPQMEAAFLREARLASSLNHAGIVTVYDILNRNGTMSIVMEFVGGSPLQLLIPIGGFPLERALEMARSIGDAVAAAHAAGIVHRDLKPANILVREDGRTKILDFGLAKIAQPMMPNGETQAESLFGGSAVGTIGYMAPEQARGEAVDARADIYALGVILYQLLTGKMPFSATNAVVLLQMMQTGEPTPLRAAKPGLPAGLEGVVERALARDPARRYGTVREMLEGLNAAAGGSTIAPEAPGLTDARTIAVLPLVNMSPDPENEYLCDGLAEELINGLTQIEGLRVVSRSSSFQCKGTSPDVRETGRRLGASYLVQGSLRRSGTNLRLTMQLSQTAEGYQIWSQRFDAQTGDLFALQDELTEAVLEKLRDQLGARFPELSTHKLPASDAYDLYLQGRFAFNRETPAEFRRALDLFSRSAAADPGFAPALIGIAEAHMRLEWYGLERASESAAAVKTALAGAQRLQKESVAYLTNLAITQSGWDWDWRGAGETFARALEAGGAQPAVHFHYGLDFLTPQWRLEEALRELETALELDPLSEIVHTAIGGCLYRMRRFDEAEKTLLQTVETNRRFGHAYWSLGRVLIEQGRHEEALQRFEEATGILGRIPAALAELGYCYGRMGRRELAHCTIQELHRMAEHEWVSPLSEALVYAGLGEREAVLRRLEKAFQMRMRQLIWVNVDPRYDEMRSHPGFAQLIRGVGLSPSEGASA